MDSPLYDPPEVIARRLKLVREAFGLDQKEFATKIGVEKNTYNPWETKKRALTFEGACLIRRRFKIPVQWLFWGDDEDRLPNIVYRKIQQAA